MKSTYLTNLLLLAIAILLLWLMTNSRQPQHAGSLADSFSSESINHIAIHRPDQQDIVLHYEEQWQLVQPINARANQTRINLLLNLLKQPIQQTIPVTDSTNLADFGLRPPTVSVQFNQHNIAFGDTEPLTGYRYIAHQHTLYLLDDDTSPLLTASAGSFIDNRLLPQEKQIKALHLPALLTQAGQQSNKLSLYQHDGSWKTEAGSRSQDALQQLVQSWQHAYAMQVVIAPGAVPADNPAQVRIEYTDQSQSRFFVTRSDSNLILFDPELALQYVFPVTMYDTLFWLND